MKKEQMDMREILLKIRERDFGCKTHYKIVYIHMFRVVGSPFG